MDSSAYIAPRVSIWRGLRAQLEPRINTEIVSGGMAATTSAGSAKPVLFFRLGCTVLRPFQNALLTATPGPAPSAMLSNSTI